jgi:ubiquinol-cytochrome c reductase iron-sulfur subunit
MSDSIRDRLKAPAGHGEQAGAGDTAGSDLTTNDFVQTDSRSGHGTQQTVQVAAPTASTAHRRDDPDFAKRAERKVAALFLMSLLGVIGFVVSFIVTPFNFGKDNYEYFTPLLGIFMTMALAGVGAGAVLWAKTLMVDEETVQQRHHMASTPEQRAETVAVLKQGYEDSGLPRRKMLLGSMLAGAGALAILPLPFLKDLGKTKGLGKTMATTGWHAGSKLLDELGRPVKLGDLEVGSVKSVFPDVPGGRHMADSAALIIRMQPDILKVRESRKDWVVDGHIVYSVICTHLGCPVKLYEQQTHHLFCPCHQSTFDAANGAKVLFGPAARNLPQLAISVDDEGYFVAQGDFNEPVGPSYWERDESYPDKVGD